MKLKIYFILTIISVYFSYADVPDDLYNRAVNGDAESQYLVGQIYDRGVGMESDPYTACIFYMMADKSGFIFMNDELSRVKSKLTAKQINEADFEADNMFYIMLK